MCRFIVCLLLCAAAGSLFGCAREPVTQRSSTIVVAGSTESSAAAKIDGVRFSSRLTKTSYAPGERATTRLTLTNTSDQVKRWNGIDFGWVNAASGAEEWSTVGLGHPYGEGPPALTLQPGESTTTVVWYMEDRPGRYTIVPTFRGAGDVATGQTPPLTFEVRR